MIVQNSIIVALDLFSHRLDVTEAQVEAVVAYVIAGILGPQIYLTRVCEVVVYVLLSVISMLMLQNII